LEKNLRAQTAGAASRKNAGSARKTPILVRPGSSATLLVEAGPLRITTTVVPLQSGSQGQQILVRNPETRGTLRATVIAPNLLKQSLLNEVSE
jgi:flagella basal body P-ring formation protein FlgA